MKRFKQKWEYIIYMGVLLALGIVFFFCLGEQGYIIEKDSGAFIEADKYLPYQYIVYPKFLQLCQNIFGEEYYLEWVSNIQGAIALIVSLITTEYIRKSYRLNRTWGIAVFLCTFGPYAYSLPQYVSSHSIMTEGLAFPLFYLWMLFALEIYLHKRNIYFLPLLLVTVLMVYTRTQLLLFVVVYVLILIERVLHFIFVRLTNQQKLLWKKSAILLAIFILFGGIFTFLFMVKNNVIPQMTDAVAGRVFCAVEESDADLFEGKNRDLFLKIFEEVEVLESRQSYFRGGIRQWEDIVDATNDNTKMLVNVIRPFYEASPDVLINDVKGELAYTLLLEHGDEYLYMTLVLMLQSLVVSIFVHPEFAYLLGFIVAIVLYISATFFVVFCKRKYQVNHDFFYPLYLTFFVIVCMCGITNILFMGIQRYVVYPFGFFYISLIVLWNGLICKRKKNGV